MSEYVTYGIPGIAFLGVLLLFWGVATLVGGGASESSMEARMARYAGGPEAKKEEKVKKKKDRKDIDPFATLSSDVQDKHLAAKVARDLARANLTLRVSEYYYIRVGLALGLGLFLGVLRDPLSGVVGAIVGYFGPRIWVGRRIGSRLNSFNKQLPDTITLIANALRAGSSFLQAIELVVRESRPPVSTVRFMSCTSSMKLGSNVISTVRGRGRSMS